MSYRIDYGRKQKMKHSGNFRLAALTLLSFLMFLMLVNSMWAEGAEYLRNLLRQLRSQTAAVLSVLETDILNRDPMTVVFSDFFQSIAHDPN